MAAKSHPHGTAPCAGTTATSERNPASVALPPTSEELFWSKVNKTDTCWLWTAAKNNMGYGYLTRRITDGSGTRKNKNYLAHRFAYELSVGPIPEGLVLDHQCHTPLCVRPAHLLPVTQEKNVQNRKGAVPGSSTGIRNVQFRDNRWIVKVHHRGTQHYIGCFLTAEEADKAAAEARERIFNGEAA